MIPLGLVWCVPSLFSCYLGPVMFSQRKKTSHSVWFPSPSYLDGFTPTATVLVYFILFSRVRYIRVCALFKSACTILECVRYSRVRALFKSVYAIQECMLYSTVRALLKSLFSIQECMHYSWLHTLFKSVWAIQECVRYLKVQGVSIKTVIKEIHQNPIIPQF